MRPAAIRDFSLALLKPRSLPPLDRSGIFQDSPPEGQSLADFVVCVGCAARLLRTWFDQEPEAFETLW